MVPVIGTGALFLGLAATIAAVLGPSRLVVAAVRVAAISLVVATSALAWALVTDDYSLAYVVDSARREAAPPYRLAGLWGGMAGSLLLWTAMLALWAVVAHGSFATTVGTSASRLLAAAQLVFLLPLVTTTRPFLATTSPPLDGLGLHPLLEHPAMLYHPPLLYLGLTGLFPGAALAAAALHRRRLDAAVDVTLRTMARRAIVLLGAGLATGAHWAYAELGWGGFWAWDPIENAGLVPWLVAVAMFHVRRRALTLGLAVAAALLAAGGAFVTRSGATVSPHAFAEAREVGWILLAGIAVATLSFLALLGLRRDIRGSGSARPVATILLGAAAVVIGIGTFAPAVAVMAGASARTVDVAFYATFAVPILVVAAAWCGREVLRATAPVAARLAHLGVVAIAVAAAGSTTGWDATVPLRQGLTTDVHGLDVSLVSVTEEVVDGRGQLSALVRIDGHPLRAALRSDGAGGVTAETAIRSTIGGDVIVTPRRLTRNHSAVLDLHRRPLVPWIWPGAATSLLGVALSRRRAPMARHLRHRGASGRATEQAIQVAAEATPPQPWPRVPSEGPEPAAVPAAGQSASGPFPAAPAGAAGGGARTTSAPSEAAAGAASAS